jgi:hypothetical protein
VRVNVASTCLFFGRNQWDTRGAKKWKMIGKPSSYGTTWNIFHFRHVLAVGLSRAAQIRLLCKQSTIKLIQPTRNRLSTTSLLPILHTIPLEELIESVERARLEAKLRYVVIYGAACSYCLARAERLDGSYLRTFALELKEQLAQTLTAFVMSILTQPRRRDGKVLRSHCFVRSLMCCSRWCVRTMQKSLRFLCSKSTKIVLCGSFTADASTASYQPKLNASIYKITTGHNLTINNESRRLNMLIVRFPIPLLGCFTLTSLLCISLWT